MAPPLLGIRDGLVTFGGRPVFTRVTLQVGRGEKCCLVGRNGSGKSTLLRVLAGEVGLDGGELFVQPGTRIGLLRQDPAIGGATVGGWVAEGLAAAERDQLYRVETLLDAFDLDGARQPAELSGGEARRASLARVLVGEPDVLLLDEPTNHLDLPTIRWLERWLADYRGGLVMISHDRAFLTAVSRQTLWLDRGEVRRAESGFAGFDAWVEAVYAAEAAEEARLDQRLEAETHWLHRGVTARRRRNMGRLRGLMALRAEKAARLKVQGSAKLAAESGEMSGRLVIEAKDVAKSFDGQVVIKPFSTRIVRGDRVGLVGANGAGKTTLLRLLCGELPPDSGTVRLGTNLQPAYFDQRRARLDPEATPWDVLTDGAGDSIVVRGVQRHVAGYLKDFLFEERQMRTPVKALSGGERNRLLLAKLLAQPANLLIMDEPTNDLDMDTLDLLEEVLADYDGTLLLVSHDRDFLNRLVTSIILFEGKGRISEHAGGFDEAMLDLIAPPPSAPAPARKPAATAEPRPAKAATRLSFNDQRELEALPAAIERLRREVEAIHTELADPGLYGRDPDRFARQSARLQVAEGELAAAEERWLTLEMRREEMAERRP
jgi:ATP-binding cassette subfamily F protein uup